MTKTNNEYLEDVRISTSDLDLDCKEQPELMLKYTKIAAEKEKIRDEKKEAMEHEYVSLDKEIRENPEEYGLEKITDKSVDNAIKRQDEYRDTMQEYIDASHEAKVAKGTVEAMQNRKNMLQELVQLYGQQYFAGPSTPRDFEGKWKERQALKKDRQKEIVKQSGKNLKNLNKNN